MRALPSPPALISRLSMYRLVLVALLLVLTWAILAAGLGWLGYSPLAIVVTTLAALAGTVVGTTAAALVARGGPPHVFSGVVTGLILGLLVLPGTDSATLLTAGVAGLAAGVSKYVIAWRGRHVLNPAAAGLIVVTLTGIGAGGWWVGSAVLLPVVLLAGAVVVWRTSRALDVLAYAVPALALTTVGYLTLGAEAADAAWWALTASPIAFLALFMLTEPLTSPPRRHQRVLVGVLVAVLAAAPLYLHWGWLTPEVALAVGNVVAFMFGPRGRTLLCLERAQRRGDMLDLWFRPSRPLPFEAGQYVEIDVPQTLALPGGRRDPRGQRRVLSVASAPGRSDLRLVTRVVARPGDEPSPVKSALAGLAVGDRVTVTAVGGDFLVPDGAGSPLALIGAGIGVTPFLAHLDAIGDGLAAPAGGWDVVLVHAVRSAEDVLPLGRPGAELPAGLPAGVRLVLVVPPEADRSGLPAGCDVVEGAALTSRVLAEAVPDLARRRVMVSGPPAAVAAVRAAALELGVHRVRTDVFLGY